MEIHTRNGAVFVREIEPICLRRVFDNGQAFRFSPCKDGYAGVAFGRYIEITSYQNGLKLFPCTREEFSAYWRDYLDLDTCYAALFEAPDNILKKGMEYGTGLRMLHQEPFETLISFIVSANNNIARIRGIVERLCARYGKSIAENLYAFPTPQALAGANCEQLRALGMGYRAPYVINTAQKICNGFDLCALREAGYAEAKRSLMTLPGVGPKVADCVLLFSLGYTQAFPADVWMKRALAKAYGFCGNDAQLTAFVQEKFGRYAGIAQQYLFYWIKNERGEIG